MLANHTSIASLFQRCLRDYDKMRRVNAYIEQVSQNVFNKYIVDYRKCVQVSQFINRALFCFDLKTVSVKMRHRLKGNPL